MSDDRRTPLYDEHVAAGARMVPFAGWAMPVQYEGIVAEHKAVRNGVGIFDVSHMGEVELSGPGARDACARLFTNDSYKLEPGHGGYSLMANEHGGLVDDVIVYCLADDRFLVCVNASNTAKDVAWIRENAPDNATVTDTSDATALFAVHGPRSLALIARMDARADALPRYGVSTLNVAGVEVLAARTGYTGEHGFELFAPAAQAVTLWRALCEEGADDGLVPVGLGARDTLRLEAALPLYGHELGEDISPYDARVAWAVKLDRPEMLGFAALTVAKMRGPQKRLIGLLPQGGIARETALVFAAGGKGGEGGEGAIGHVTSGSHAPTLGHAIALASVTCAAAEAAESADGSFEIEIRGKRRAAAMTGLPFYVRQSA
ncbi:MAG: aminomethyltransferase [Hyphomicrobiaceae bacterium]